MGGQQSPFYKGQKPFRARVDIESARQGLTKALARARERIDWELGPRQWTWIDPLAEEIGTCDEGGEIGGAETSRQGMTPGIPQGCFPELLEIVRQEIAPLDFTEAIDISEGDVSEVNYFNVDDGGYVGVVLAGDTPTFSMRYTTGCRPLP